MTVYKDIADAESLSRDRDGYTAERVFIVDRVTGTPESKLYNAMVTGGIPQYGDPHPSIPDLQVTSIRADARTSSQVRISVTYTIPKPDDINEIEADEDETSGSLSVTSNLSNEVVFRDISGELLRAQYYALGEGGFTIEQKYEEAEVQRPQLQVQFTRIESSVPKANIQKFLGKVNSVAWSGFPPKTWLCSGIVARENKAKFDIEYQFTYRADTWRLEIVVGISQEEADSFPIDVNSGNGYAVFDVYETADFNALGLNF